LLLSPPTARSPTFSIDFEEQKKEKNLHHQDASFEQQPIMAADPHSSIAS